MLESLLSPVGAAETLQDGRNQGMCVYLGMNVSECYSSQY